MSDQAVLLPKWSPDWRIILAKYQLGPSYTFWIMPILIFSLVQIIMGHPLWILSQSLCPLRYTLFVYCKFTGFLLIFHFLGARSIILQQHINLSLITPCLGNLKNPRQRTEAIYWKMPSAKNGQRPPNNYQVWWYIQIYD